MSYFYCGFGDVKKVKSEFDTMFGSIVPVDFVENAIQLPGKIAIAKSFCSDKIIPDIAIASKKNDSWILVTGTPLVQLGTERDKQEFLEEFLDNPKQTLRRRIDGQFAVFCFDSINRKLIVATDINVTIPVFYSKTSTGAVFCSNELLLAKHLNAEIDPAGFSQAIHLGITWEEDCRYKGLHKMNPCQVLTMDTNGVVKKEVFWQPTDETEWSGNLDNAIHRWLKILDESVNKYYVNSGKKPVYCDLTGGEDARIIVAQLHNSSIPFTALSSGLSEDELDITIPRKASIEANIELIVKICRTPTKEQLENEIFNIVMPNEGYQDFYKSSIEYATRDLDVINEYRAVKYGGIPGGEAFRGSYYLRGKAPFPSLKVHLDRKFFIKMKFLLDYYPGLLRFEDGKFMDMIDSKVVGCLDDVSAYPVGTQIDHLLRRYQTCGTGLKYRGPLYFPLGNYDITRTIYNLSPDHKRGGRLTKACTEILFPELAFIRTQNGVPTIRKTIKRLPYFFPEYTSQVKKIYNGALSRLFKLTPSTKGFYSFNANMDSIRTVFNNPSNSSWFSSTEDMLTGSLYNPDIVNPILSQAKKVSESDNSVHKYAPLLSKIVNQELAYRWIRGETGF